jgi:hypothetical protein
LICLLIFIVFRLVYLDFFSFFHFSPFLHPPYILSVFFSPYLFSFPDFSIFISVSRSFPLGPLFLIICFCFLTFRRVQILRVSCTRNIPTRRHQVLSSPVKEDSQCFSVSGFPGTSFGGPCKQKMLGRQVDGVLMSLIELLSLSSHASSNT